MISINSLNSAQPLPSIPHPSMGRGERGWGWSQCLLYIQDITDPTPAPPLDGRGVGARCFFNL